MGSDAVWKVGDVAKFLKMSPSWVYARVEDNSIPHTRLGSSIRFDPDEVKTWFKAREKKPGSTTLVKLKREE